MKRKVLLILSVVLVLILALPVTSSAFVSKKLPDPYFTKYSKPVTVTLAVPTNSSDQFPKGDSYKNNVWTRSVKEDLNIVEKVVWTADAASMSYRTKLNLAIASNNLPDIITCYEYSQFDKLLKAGKLEDLTSYYNKYGYPFFKQCINEDGGLALSLGNVKGKQMGIPGEGSENLNMSARMIFIRHDWFVKTGLPAPKSMEDIIAIAKAMREQDPKTRFALPLFKNVMNDNMSDIVGMCNAFGAYPRIWLDNGKGQLAYGSIQPEMKKAIQVYADLYKQGMIDPAFASLDGGKVGEQLTSNKIGIVIGGFWLPSWPLNSLWELDGVDWDVYPLLQSSTLKNKAKVQMNSPQGKMVAIRKGYAHPEVLFKLINYTTAKISDPKYSETLKFHSNPADKVPYSYFAYNPIYWGGMWGPQNTNFNTNINVTNAIDKNDKSYLKTPHDQTQYNNVTEYLTKSKSGERKGLAGQWAMYKFFYGPNTSFGVLNKYKQNNSFLLSKLPGYQTPEMVRSWKSLNDLEDQYVIEMISGKRPVSDFDKYVQAWRDLGGEVCEYEANQWYKTK